MSSGGRRSDGIIQTKSWRQSKILSIKLSSDRLWTFVAMTAYSGSWAAVHTQCVWIFASVSTIPEKVLLSFVKYLRIFMFPRISGKMTSRNVKVP